MENLVAWSDIPVKNLMEFYHQLLGVQLASIPT